MSFDIHASPHEILGVSPRASSKQVRKAYKKLARRYHPDHNDAPDATARFMAIKAAHDEMLRRIASGYIPPEPPRARRAGPSHHRTGPSASYRPPGQAPRPEPPRPGTTWPSAWPSATQLGAWWSEAMRGLWEPLIPRGEAPPPSAAGAPWADDPKWDKLRERQRAEASASLWRLAMYVSGFVFWFVAFSVFMASLREMSDAMTAPREPPEEQAPGAPRDASNEME